MYILVSNNQISLVVILKYNIQIQKCFWQIQLNKVIDKFIDTHQM